jgi:hypothetical protein
MAGRTRQVLGLAAALRDDLGFDGGQVQRRGGI